MLLRDGKIMDGTGQGRGEKLKRQNRVWRNAIKSGENRFEKCVFTRQEKWQKTKPTMKEKQNGTGYPFSRRVLFEKWKE